MSSPNINSLYQTIKKLRDPKTGCPWDIKQTHLSLRKYLIEECYEAINAMEKGDNKELLDELGDVQLQILLHSIIEEESNNFSLQDVFNHLEEKIIRRHPHVFSNISKISVSDVKENWKKIKQEENKEQSKKQKIYITKKQTAAPALKAAENIGRFTEEKGFDWSAPEEVIKKVEEELEELKVEIRLKNKNEQKVQEELGDLIFTIAQLSRHLGFCPEETLKQSNEKFQLRYNQMINLNAGRDISELTGEQKELLWKKVKEGSKNE
jgi:MazG family protein